MRYDPGFEIRKVEVYLDGRHDYADGTTSTGTTGLGLVLTPRVEELNADPEFSGRCKVSC
ncbi:MAG: DUF6881 domain-containing protein [Trebonia sp.]